MKRQLIGVVLFIVMCFSLNIIPAVSSGYESIKVNVGTKELSEGGLLVDGRALVPLRAVAEATDAQVGWDATWQRITLKKLIFSENQSGEAETSVRIVYLWIDKNEAIVDGQTATMDVAPKLIDGVTMAPIRAVSEWLGFDVKWDSMSKTVNVASGGADETKANNQKDTTQNANTSSTEASQSLASNKSSISDNGEDKYDIIERDAAEDRAIDRVTEDIQGYTVIEYITELDLIQSGVMLVYGSWAKDYGVGPGFYKFDQTCATLGQLIYATPSFNRNKLSASKETEVDGVRMIMAGGSVKIRNDDLKRLNILGNGYKTGEAHLERVTSELEKYINEWPSANMLKNLYNISTSQMGGYIYMSRGSESYKIEGAPKSQFETGKIYTGTWSGYTIRFQYIKTLNIGNETQSINQICFNLSDLKGAGIVS